MKQLHGAKSFTHIFSLLFRLSDSDPMATWRDAVCENWSALSSYVLWEFNALLWISLFAVTIVLSEKVLKVFKLWYLGRKIPGPPFLSFFGRRKFISRESITDLLSDSHQKYGSVIKLWLGPKSLFVSVKDPSMISDMLMKAEDKLPSTEKAFRLAFGQSSLFASSFDKVEKSRRSFALELNRKLLDISNLGSTEAVNSVVEQLSNITMQRKCDSKMVAHNLAFSVLGIALLGDTFLDWTKATTYRDHLNKIGQDACLWASYSITPFWKQEFWKYQHLRTKLKLLTQELLHQCQNGRHLFYHSGKSINAEPGNTGILGNAPSYVVSKGFDEHIAASDETAGNLMGVIFHSLLTTSSLIGDILPRLIAHPEIQNRIYAEVVKDRNGSKKLEHYDVDKMPLLLATIYESARLLPAGALLQRCCRNQDIKLKNGLVIPAGAMVVVPLQLLHIDHSYWGSDAHDFNPYRFLSKASESVHDTAFAGSSCRVFKNPRTNPAYLSFGSGTRACPGEKFLIHVLAALLAGLLERYEIKTRQGSNRNPEPVINSQPNPDIVFVRRGN